MIHIFFRCSQSHFSWPAENQPFSSSNDEVGVRTHRFAQYAGLSQFSERRRKELEDGRKKQEGRKEGRKGKKKGGSASAHATTSVRFGRKGNPRGFAEVLLKLVLDHRDSHGIAPVFCCPSTLLHIRGVWVDVLRLAGTDTSISTNLAPPTCAVEHFVQGLPTATNPQSPSSVAWIRRRASEKVCRHEMPGCTIVLTSFRLLLFLNSQSWRFACLS